MSRSPEVTLAASCRAVRKVYRGATGDTVALDDVDADLPVGEVTALTGPSGSGKSSLLRICAGLDEPTAGSVYVGDVAMADLSAAKRRRVRRKLTGYVFQRPSDNLIAYLTVEQHLELARGIRGSDEDPLPLLEMLGIEHRLHNRPDQLSGGEQQRLAFAMAAVGSPPLVLADEPTAELDTASAQALIEVLEDLASRGTAVVVATHDPSVAAMAGRKIRIESGKVVT